MNNETGKPVIERLFPILPDFMLDNVAVDIFAEHMKEKLGAARSKGRAGWADPDQVSEFDLSALFCEHLRKSNAGNFLDLANLAMMMHLRKMDPSIIGKELSTGGYGAKSFKGFTEDEMFAWMEGASKAESRRNGR